MQSPVKKEYVTQIFGVNAAAYAKFGLKGHNGIDYRAFLPNGERCYKGGKSEVFAPHSGIVKECAFDANGFGNYVKIEDGTQGSVLAHFSSLPNFKVGQSVKQGQFIGYQGTTGNSTGIHLHWGWYPIPRNRSNGFNGYENQAGKYSAFSESEKPMPAAGTYKGIDLSNIESVRVAIDTWKDVIDGKYVRRDEFDKALADKESLYQETQRLSGLINELKLELAGEKKQTAELQSARQLDIDKIAEAVGSLADVPSILKFVEMNTEETEQFRKKVKSLETQLSEAQSARQDEIDQLKRDIDQLRQVNERQATHIETLENRLSNLETSGQTIVPIWEKIMEIVAIFRKGSK
jgi:hypothetical protein